MSLASFSPVLDGGVSICCRVFVTRWGSMSSACVPELDTPDHEGVACFQDFEQALDGCSADAVILATPNHLHGPQLRAAAARGLHVFCEKPLSLSADEAREMAAIMSSAGLVLGIGHERRFEPAMQRIADWVHNGELGTILHTEAAFSHDKLAGLAAGQLAHQA